MKKKHDNTRFANIHRLALDHLVADARGRGENLANNKTIAAQIHAESPNIAPSSILDPAKPSKGIKPQICMVEAIVRRLAKCKDDCSVPSDFMIRYLEAAGHPSARAFLANLKVSGCYTKEHPKPVDLVGRKELIDEAVALLSGSGQILLLCGLSGSGKTVVAAHSANQTKTRMDEVVWVTATESPSPLNLKQLLDTLAEKLYMNELKKNVEVGERMIQLCRNIREQKLKILLVVDNFNAVPEPDATQILQFLSDHFSTLEECCAIITTQRRPDFPIQRHVYKEIEGLPIDDGVKLMQQLIKNRVKVHVDLLKDIVTAAGGNPAVLITAAQNLTDLGTAEEFLAALQSGKGDIWFTAFYESVWSRLSDEVKIVVSATSLFPKSVSEETLEEVCDLGTKFKPARKNADSHFLIDRYGLDAKRIGQHELVRHFASNQLRENPTLAKDLRVRWAKWAVKFSARFERDKVWNCHWRLQELELHESSDLVAVQSVLEWAKAQEDWPVFLQIGRNLRYFYYTRGLWKLERDTDLIRADIAQRLDYPVEKFDALIYHLNVACKQENLDEIDQCFFEVERLWALRDEINLPALMRAEYRHVRALVEETRRFDGWEQRSLELREENRAFFEAYEKEARKKVQEWSSFSFHLNVNLRYLGKLYYDLQDWEKARALLKKALDDSQEKGFQRGCVWVTLKLAALDIQEGLVQKALSGLNKITPDAEALKDVLVLGQMEFLRAEALEQLGEFERARFFYFRARTHFELLECEKNLSKVAFRIEELERKIGGQGNAESVVE